MIHLHLCDPEGGFREWVGGVAGPPPRRVVCSMGWARQIFKGFIKTEKCALLGAIVRGWEKTQNHRPNNQKHILMEVPFVDPPKKLQ